MFCILKQIEIIFVDNFSELGLNKFICVEWKYIKMVVVYLWLDG